MYAAGSGAIELTKVNTLPGAEYQRAVFDDDGFGAADHGRFNMGGGVALDVSIIVIERDTFVKLRLDVGGDAGIGVLVYGDPGGGMWYENNAGAVFDVASAHGIL